MSEYFGGKWIVFIGILGSGILNVLTPLLSKSVGLLLVSRIVLGLLQGSIFPAMFFLINSWLLPQEKSVGYGLSIAGGNLGALAASALTGSMSEMIGWKSSFYTIGAVTIIWTGIWFLTVEEYRTSDSDTRSEKDGHQDGNRGTNYIKKSETDLSQSDTRPEKDGHQDGNGGTNDIKKSGTDLSESKSLMNAPWFRIFTNIPVLACVTVQMGGNIAYLTLQTKLPGYLNDVLHIEPSLNGQLNSLLYVSICISMTGGSYLSEIFIKKRWLTRTHTRKAFTSIGLLICSICFCILPSCGCDTVLIVIILTISMCSYGLRTGGDMILPAEMSQFYSSTIYAYCNTVANLVAGFTPVAIGSVLSRATNSSELKKQWDIVFYSVAAIVTIATIIFAGFASAEFQKDIDDRLFPKNVDGNFNNLGKEGGRNDENSNSSVID